MKRAVYGLLMALAVGLVVALALSWGRREEMGRPPPSDVAPISSSAAADPFEADLENWRPSSIRQVVDPRYPDQLVFIAHAKVLTVNPRSGAFVAQTKDNQYLTVSVGAETEFSLRRSQPDRQAHYVDRIPADFAAIVPGRVVRIAWLQNVYKSNPQTKLVASSIMVQK